MAASGFPRLVRGAVRQSQVPSCLLTPRDLRDLYNLLSRKAAEAADLQAATLTLQKGQTQQQLDELRTQVRDNLSLVLRVQMAGGHWVNSMTIDPLTDEQFPNRIVRIEFNSFFLYQSTYKLIPDNNFIVILDFNRPSILDMNNVPAPNLSSMAVSGLNATWTNGLYDELTTFFRQRPTRRGWLHFSQSYTLLVFLVGFPLSFRILAYLAPIIRRRTTLPDALAVALYVYIVLLVLFLFRITFNYARWIFPAVEIDAPRQHVAVAHKAAIVALGGMIIAALVAAVLRILGIG